MESKYIRADLFWNKIAENMFFSAREKEKIRVAIENEPGEDVTPAVHAHWIPDESETGEDSNTYKCSSCGGVQIIIYGTPKENGWNYCPSCGAKMDEKEKQMRPIDADALEKTLRDWIRDHWTEAFTGDDAASEFADMIERAETIDTNPTVHAYWIERRANNGNVHYTCSRCGKEVSYPYAKKRWKYCIECGAKMDEEDRDD